jgi:two-component system sensor histidine kinase DesK
VSWPGGFRLLPRDGAHGWTPYAWLLYLGTFLIEPVIRTGTGRAGGLYWAATAAGLAVFLAAYFRGYWLAGRRLLWVVGVHTALGVLFSPINVGACVFYVYGAATAGAIGEKRLALPLIAGVSAVGAATAFLTAAPGFYWIAAVPVAVVIGAVNLHYAEVALAQRQLRRAQEEVEHMAAVAERERIARDLHDVLGHTLSLIVLKSELAGRLAERDAARAAAEIREVEQVARRTLQEVREAIRGYRATLADEAARARALLTAAGIAADIDVATAGLPPAIEETLAFALREAATNAARHSGASRCRVRLERSRDEVRLHVEDDGRGSAAPDGTGLRGMRERVEACGGRVERGGTAGTTLVVRVPTAPPAADGAAAGAPQPERPPPVGP